MTGRPLSRGRLSGIIVTVLALASGCTAAAPTIGDRTPAPSDRSTDPSDEPPPAPTRFPIKHVVFLIKENRSFDNLFGRFPGANGATVGMHHGAPRPLIRGSTDSRETCRIATRARSPHGTKARWTTSNRVVRRVGLQPARLEQLPNYWRWAKEYVLFDRFFASAHGPSFPNHLYTIAAQSGGAVDNPLRNGVASYSWGCDLPEKAVVQVIDSEGDVEFVLRASTSSPRATC